MRQKIYLIGAGMGDAGSMTREGEDALRKCQCIIGAPRLLERFSDDPREKQTLISAQEIATYIGSHPELERIAVLFSGDLGFYSGAKKLRPLLQNCDVISIGGVSSLQYFCARLGTDWQDVVAVSLHGFAGDAADAVRRHARVFFLTGGENSAQAICRSLTEAGLGQTHIAVGERLSYPDERITFGCAKALKEQTFAELSVVLAQREGADIAERDRMFYRKSSDFEQQPDVSCSSAVTVSQPFSTSGSDRAKHRHKDSMDSEQRFYTDNIFGIPDEEFVRAQVPMTKSEVRCVSLSKLRVRENDVIYDIGAGTGSVSIEAARLARNGRVYAIEREAIACSCIRKNCLRFGVSNVVLVQGEAPGVLGDLPAPDCVFVGGSAGKLKRILEVVHAKNPRIRVVINAITIETVAQAVQVLKELNFSEPDIVQLSVSRSRAVGNYHMMQALNPITILCAEGQGC